MISQKKEQEISTQTSEISKFYQGKSLFITGAAGFLGLVLLETLLRCCPGIARIYILLRPKKGVQPEDRKEIIFKKEIFYKIKEQNPDALKKVIVVSGDVFKENLGICETDLIKITEEVSVVFHCAAAITFLKSLNFMIQQNVMGTQNIIELCRKLKKLDVLVYTSTAYSNCNRKCIEEKVYKLPFKADEVLELSKKGCEKELDSLFKKCNPQFPNFYTFSKCVAENLISEKASDLPITIVRPSIIICCVKGVSPGFFEYGSGIVSFCIGIGKGFIRVVRVDQEKVVDIIPVDVVANTHIVAACRQASERLPCPVIYNCASGEICTFLWRDFVWDLMAMVLKKPLPRTYQRPSITLCKNPVKYWFFSMLDHYIPAIIIDFLLWITGGKPRLFKLYQFYDRNMKVLSPFTLNEWELRSKNFRSLYEKLNTTDTEMFPMDLKDFTISELTEIMADSPVYRRKKGDKPQERRPLTDLRYYFTSFIRWSVLGCLVSFFYMAVF